MHRDGVTSRAAVQAEVAPFGCGLGLFGSSRGADHANRWPNSLLKMAAPKCPTPLPSTLRRMPLIARQVGWRDQDAILCAPDTDPAGLAARIVRLYRDEALSHRVRDGALERLAVENSETVYADTIAGVLRGVRQV